MPTLFPVQIFAIFLVMTDGLYKKLYFECYKTVNKNNQIFNYNMKYEETQIFEI